MAHTLLRLIGLVFVLLGAPLPTLAGVVGGTHNFMCSPNGAHGPCIDHSKDPAPATPPGTDEARVKWTTFAPNAAVHRGAFRTICFFSHVNHDDPIVYPNLPGRSHSHTWFGNTGGNAFSTHESLRTTGKSTCFGGTLNRTAYWVPSMIDIADGSVVWPLILLAYYKDEAPGIPLGSVVPPPDGLKILTGDMNRQPRVIKNSWEVPGDAYWKCQKSTEPTKDPRTGTIFPATDIPDALGKQSATIPNCPVGSFLNQELHFPRCVAKNADGTPMLDSPNHRSHMAYANWYTGCPATHPIAIPQISEIVRYLVTAPLVTATKVVDGVEVPAAWRWRLSSDMYSFDQAPGWSNHGDWFDGWDPQIKTEWTVGCLHTPLDCKTQLLGPKRRVNPNDPLDLREMYRTLY